MVWVGGVVWGEWWCDWDEGWYGLVVWFGVSGGVIGMRGGMGWWCGLG